MSAAAYPRVFPKDALEWRGWLRANHKAARGVWLITYRRTTDRPHVAYVDAVEEALCYGWIDGMVQSVDDERLAQLFAPRRPGSGWSRTNKERVARLIAGRRMRAAGLARIAAAKRDGSWNLLDSVEAVAVPADLRAALRRGGATKKFEGLSKTAKRMHLYALVTAKRPETRAKRITAIVRALEG